MLITCEQTCLERKITLAEKFTLALETKYRAELARTVLPWETLDKLKSLVTDILARLDAVPDSSALQQRLQNINKTLDKTMAFNTAFRQLEQLGQGRLPDPASVENLIHYLDAKIKTQPETARALLSQSSTALQKAADLLNQLLKRDFFLAPNNDYIQKQLDHTLALSAIVTRYGTQEQRFRLANKMPKTFLKYLDSLAQCGDTSSAYANKKSAIEAFELVLSTLGAAIPFATKTIGEYLAELVQFRKNKSFVLIPIRARAIGSVLGRNLLHDKLIKDLDCFERKLLTALIDDKPHSDASLTEIFDLCDQLSQSNCDDVRDLELSNYQKSLLDLDQNKEPIADFVNVSAALRRTIAPLEKQKLSLTKSTLIADQLARTVTNMYQRFPFTERFGAQLLFSQSDKRLLFSKRYLKGENNAITQPTQKRPQ